MRRFIFSDFPVNGIEVDEYCLTFADEYGETSDVFKAVDEEYANAKSIDGTWCGFLNDLRERLINRGFEKEVERRDEEFEAEMQVKLSAVSKYSGKTICELRKSHIPLSERM